MSVDPSTSNQSHPPHPDSEENSQELTQDVDYDPGETLGRAMNLGCWLVLIAVALVSCGFIVSVFSLHR
jgi:uncharacterized protein HemX